MQSQNSENKTLLIFELIILFILIPFSLATNIPIAIKLLVVLTALIYCILVCKKLGLFTKTILFSVPFKDTFFTTNKNMLIRIAVFMALSTLAMFYFYPERLFYVVANNPMLWIGISVFYVIFSVYPQEFLYRSFFFARYGKLVKNVRWFVLMNAVLFSFAHVMFENSLVYLLTFSGGILFAYTFSKEHSLMLVSFEHAVYGLWLYTLGIGHLLAFPG